MFEESQSKDYRETLLQPQCKERKEGEPADAGSLDN